MSVQRMVQVFGLALCLALAVAGCEWTISAPESGSRVGSGATGPAPASAGPSSTLPPTIRPDDMAGSSLSDAMAKTRSAKTYRIALDVTTGARSDNTSTTDVFLSLEGVVLDAASRFTYSKGTFNDLLGGGDQIEVINLEQRTYIRGSALFGGADPSNWYVLPTDF